MIELIEKWVFYDVDIVVSGTGCIEVVIGRDTKWSVRRYVGFHPGKNQRNTGKLIIGKLSEIIGGCPIISNNLSV